MIFLSDHASTSFVAHSCFLGLHKALKIKILKVIEKFRPEERK